MSRLEQIKKLNHFLLAKMPMYKQSADQFLNNIPEQRRLLRSLMNIRPPKTLDTEYIALQYKCFLRNVKKKGIPIACTAQAFFIIYGYFHYSFIPPYAVKTGKFAS